MNEKLETSQADEEPKHLSELYDHREDYEQRIKPLVGEIHSICEELGLPMIISVCGYNGKEDLTISGSFFLPGFERTPHQFVAASSCIQEEGFATSVLELSHIIRTAKDRGLKVPATLEA